MDDNVGAHALERASRTASASRTSARSVDACGALTRASSEPGWPVAPVTWIRTVCTLSGQELKLARMRRTFLWINFVLASAIVLLIFVQAYLIATWAIGNQSDEGVLDAHGIIGGLVIHGLRVARVPDGVRGLAAGGWRWIGVTFGLFVLGTVQIFLLPPDDDPVSSSAAWVHGLHGLLALFVMVYAAFMAHQRHREDLGLRRRRRRRCR